jgi:DNA polymerase III delta prime subunit
MGAESADPRCVLAQSVATGRVHAAYLISGSGDAPRDAALWLARALACQAGGTRAPCEACPACRRSRPREPIALDGSGRQGPLLRHVGEHPDLLWVERGAGDTRVRIGQIRALQAALRLRSSEGGRRAAVIADAEWLNQESQNALLRLLEEPPPETTLVLVAQSSAGLLATVRSRCQRVAFPAAPGATPDDEPARAETVARLERLGEARLPEILDWAEEFRGPRAVAAAGAAQLLAVASSWLHHRVCEQVLAGAGDPRPGLEAFDRLSRCRKALAQRNANPQMVAERALLALQGALA